MEDTEKKKKIILIALAGVILFALFLVALLLIIASAEDEKNKMYIDGVMSKMDNRLIVQDDGTQYFAIEYVAPLLSYEFYNGEYGKASEDKTKCYIKNANELSIFEMDSRDIYKILVGNTDNMYEKFILSNPVKRINDKLYVNMQGLKRAFNITADYDSEKNVLKINTLNYLYEQYNKWVKEKGYTELSKDFSNQKAILEDSLIVQNKAGYGVINSKGETIIGTKYSMIKYMENANEFIVQTSTMRK